MNLNYPGELPVVAEKKAIIEAIQNNQVVIIAGETGSGKTTQLPKMCLEALPKNKKMIGVTQPRRIAASSVAARVAEELQGPGHIVGHKIRFQDKTGRATRIKFMTDGVLLAETKNDRLLQQYGVLIIDEAHERSLNIDFLLGYLKTLLLKRADLKLIVTSATIDTAAFARHFADAPVIAVPGRSYPVEISYHPAAEENEEQEGKVEHAVAVLDELFRSRPQGDILLFLPTEQDIRQCCSLLENRYQATTVLPLFGRLASGDQAKIFRPAKGIKIIVATNVAETSITVPGIRYVVDSGYARISRYNVRARTTALPVSKISQASARQRAGRAGRIAPGFCFRLYAEEDFLQREEFTVPEIQRTNLAEVILQMISFRLGEPENFPFLDAPHPSAIREGYALLRELGAIQGHNHLTPRGKIMARLPVDPCISRILLEAKENNSLTETTIIAAVLAIQDPRIRPAESEQQADEAHARFRHKYSDFLSLLAIWRDFHQDEEKAPSWSSLKKYCKKNYLSFQRMREWMDLHAQLIRILTKEKDAFIFNRQPASYEQIHRALLCGFLRNIAKKRQEERKPQAKGTSRNAVSKTKNKNIFQGGQNKELTIFPGSGLFARPPEWILAANFMETSRLYALTVAAIEPEWVELAAGHLCNYSWADPCWHKKSGQVLAKETVSLFGLVVATRNRVNFGKRSRKNIAEARSIFIQQALLTGELNGNYPFLVHNIALLEKWQQSEAKLRSRNLIVDEQSLALFYDKRLPENIYSQPLLNRFLKKKGSQNFLKMRESDILARDFAEKELIDFPRKRTIAGIDLSLDYTFSPGSEEDGITFRLPVLFAQNVQLHHFDWLVPGLLREKITFLLKGLVKSLRKRLVPIQQSVDYLLDEIEFGKGNLLSAMESAIFKQFHISIHRSDWQQELPLHLTPRFVLFDDNDRELAAGRDLALLLQQVKLPPAAVSGKKGKESPLIAKWQGTSHSSWNFDELPPQIPICTAAGEMSGFLYPVLQTDRDQGCLIVQFEQSRQKAAEINEEALLYLFSRQFREQCKQLKRLISTSFSGPSTLIFGSLKKTKPEITGLLLTQLLKQIYGEYGQSIPSSSDFANRVEVVKKEGFYRCGQRKWEQFMAALRKRRSVAEQLAAFSAKSKAKGHFYREGYGRLEQELQAIFPVQVLYKNPDYLEISRQLDYLSLRLERFYVSPLKDEQKCQQITPFTAKLQSIDCMQQFPCEAEDALQKYREMLLEFKISVFAPEIKRRFPVSPKKLEAQWQQTVKYLPLR